VFLYAALPKMADPSSLAESIRNYHVAPDDWPGALSWILPSIELVAALALVGGPFVAGGAAAICGLLVVYTFGMAQAMARGIDIECGCFGASASTSIGWHSIARNLVLLAMAILVLFTDGGRSRKERPPHAEPDGG
jgi:uncharacterized membrane protein YphA (DoxX/SURF4 family)